MADEQTDNTNEPDSHEISGGAPSKSQDEPTGDADFKIASDSFKNIKTGDAVVQNGESSKDKPKIKQVDDKLVIKVPIPMGQEQTEKIIMEEPEEPPIAGPNNTLTPQPKKTQPTEPRLPTSVDNAPQTEEKNEPEEVVGAETPAQKKQPQQTEAGQRTQSRPSVAKPNREHQPTKGTPNERPKKSRQEPVQDRTENKNQQQPKIEPNQKQAENKKQPSENETVNKPKQEKNCPNCGAKLNPDGSCGHCGSQPQKKGGGIKNCPNCGATLNPDGSCGYCGKKAEQSTQSPQTTTPEQQKEAAGDMQNEKQKKGPGQRLGDTGRAIKNAPGNAARGIGNAAKGVGNAIRNPKKTLKNVAKKTARNAAANMRGLTIARNKLRREAKKMEKELSALNDKTPGSKNSWEMKIIKFFFPGIYAKITGVTNIPGNAKLEIIIKILQAKVVRLESAKRALQAAEGISASYDAIMTTWGIISTGLGLFIVPGVIAILFSPIIFICLMTFYWTTTKGITTGAIDKVVKQVDGQLKPLKEKLEITKKKLGLRRGISQKYQEISQTDHLSIARDKQNQQQESQERQSEQQPPDQNQPQNNPLPNDDPYNNHTN